MPRACVIVLDAVGAGALPDAEQYGDEGSDTLGNVAKAVDRKSTRLNSSHDQISYAVFCLKKKKQRHNARPAHQHTLWPAPSGCRRPAPSAATALVCTRRRSPVAVDTPSPTSLCTTQPT